MITVLITTYNNKEYIGSAICSVLMQEYSDYELLIIDDGSDDGTEAAVKSFKNTRINYIRTEHKGRSSALNLGLKISAYDWVTLLDADDLMAHGKLQRLSAFISGVVNKIVTTWMAVFTKNRILYSVKYPVDNLSLKKFLLVHSFNNSVFFNRQFILANGGYRDTVRAEDYDLWLRIINEAEFVCIPEILSFHRYSHHSFSNKNFNITKRAIKSIQEKNRIEMLDYLETGVTERADILRRREYFFGESILSCQPGGLTLKYVLLFLLSLLPSVIGNRIKILNLKARIVYIIKYYCSEHLLLRGNLKLLLGDADQFEARKCGGDF